MTRDQDIGNFKHWLIDMQKEQNNLKWKTCWRDIIEDILGGFLLFLVILILCMLGGVLI